MATKLFIAKSNFDQIEAQNFGDWVWLMAQLSFCSNDGKSLSRVEIKLQGVPPFIAYLPKNIDEVNCGDIPVTHPELKKLQIKHFKVSCP